VTCSLQLHKTVRGVLSILQFELPHKIRSMRADRVQEVAALSVRIGKYFTQLDMTRLYKIGGKVDVKYYMVESTAADWHATGNRAN